MPCLSPIPLERYSPDQKIKTKTVATSVSGHSVIVKKIPLPVMSEEELEESIQWEAEQHIPFDISDVNLDYQVLNTESAASSDVLLVAVKKDKILNHTNVITQAGKVPVVVDIDAFAIQNAFETNYNPAPNATIALLNIGASIMNIVVTRGGMPLFTRDVSVGGNQFTDALQKDMNLSFEEAEQVKQGKSIEGVQSESVVVPCSISFRSAHAGDPEDLRFLPRNNCRRTIAAYLCQRRMRQS